MNVRKFKINYGFKSFKIFFSIQHVSVTSEKIELQLVSTVRYVIYINLKKAEVPEPTPEGLLTKLFPF